MFFLYSILSALFFALIFYFRKQSSRFLSPYADLVIELLAALVIILTIISINLLHKKEIIFQKNGLIFAILAGSSLAGGMLFNYLALKTGLLSRVVAITLPAQIIFGIVLGLLLLKEHLSIVHILGIVLSVLGIFLLTK